MLAVRLNSQYCHSLETSVCNSKKKKNTVKSRIALNYFKQVIDWINHQLKHQKITQGNTKLLIHIYLFNCTKQKCINIHYYTCTKILVQFFFFFFLQIFSKQTQIAEVWWFQGKRKMHRRSGGDKNSNLLGSRQDHKQTNTQCICHQFLKIENQKGTQRLDCQKKKKKKKKTPPFTQSKETAKTFRVGWDGKEKVGILKLMPYRMQNDDLKNKHLSEQLDTLNACAWLARQAQL